MKSASTRGVAHDRCDFRRGDADTTACVAGALAEAHYGEVPAAIQAEVLRRLDQTLYEEVMAFAGRYGVRILWKKRDPQCGIDPA